LVGAVNRCSWGSIVLFLGELVMELAVEGAIDIGRFVLTSCVGVSVGLGSAEIVRIFRLFKMVRFVDYNLRNGG